jgi:hypothetical protein
MNLKDSIKDEDVLGLLSEYQLLEKSLISYIWLINTISFIGSSMSLEPFVGLWLFFSCLIFLHSL